MPPPSDTWSPVPARAGARLGVSPRPMKVNDLARRTGVPAHVVRYHTHAGRGQGVPAHRVDCGALT
jgi:hypothetical protein